MLTINAPAEPNYVVQVNYTYKGTDGQFSSAINNSIFYSVVEGNFIPYNELTPEIVNAWILNSLGVDGVESYQSTIADQINNEINPPVSPENTPLPWEN